RSRAAARQLPASGGVERSHRGEDQDLVVENQTTGLDEEAERKARDHAQAGQSLPAADGEGRLPGQESLFGGSQAVEVEATLADFERHRVRRQPALAIGHPHPERGRTSRVDLVRQDRDESKTSHALFGQQPGDDDEREQQGGQQVQQVVAGVHGGEAQRQRRPETPPPVAGRPDRPAWPEEVPEPLPRQRGTGTLSASALTTVSAPLSPPEAARRSTRWESAGTASALRSSGTRNS